MFDWECPSDEMKALQVVTLPYNLLLHRDAREVLGIDLTNQVVVIDEAHSECFCITGTESPDRDEYARPYKILYHLCSHYPLSRSHWVL